MIPTQFLGVAQKEIRGKIMTDDDMRKNEGSNQTKKFVSGQLQKEANTAIRNQGVYGLKDSI